MTKEKMMEIVLMQLSVDYNCKPEDFFRDDIIFTYAQKNEGRRDLPFRNPRLEMITMGRGVIVNASPNIMPYVKRKLQNKTRYDIMNSSLVYGINPYYLPDIDHIKLIENNNYKFKLFEKDKIGFLYNFKGFKNALQYDERLYGEDVLAVAAYDGEKIIGVAGASADSKTMWQIGVDVFPEYRGNQIAPAMVNTLTLEILDRGIVPYYSTDCTNIASQRVAVKSGYIPSWSHCYRSRITKNPFTKFVLNFVK